MSLYRKYRPQTFQDVVGQKHVVKTLKGAIGSGQIGHAYIFSGPRGIGKTSVARIFAKAVNCLDLKDNEPCDKCDVCRQITDGAFLDLIEIDAASNRGIDDIRSLKEKINFAPNIGKYKVYIIDEVHMLSRDAFNALLKTLEEPPSHVIFVLATTESQKVPITILSRCQRFDFKRINSVEMVDAIKVIVKKEKIKTTDSIIEQIVSLGEGSLRDSLSYLDQVYAFSGGGELDEQLLEDVLGVPKKEVFLEFLGIISDKKIQESIAFLHKLSGKGIDFEAFLKNFIRFLRQLILCKIDRSLAGDMIVDEKIEKILAKMDLTFLTKIAGSFNEVLKNSRYSFLPELYLELHLVELFQEDSIDSANRDLSVTKNTAKSLEEQNFIAKENTPISLYQSSGSWSEFIEKIKEERASLAMVLQGCQHEETKEKINIIISNGFYFDKLTDRANLEFLESISKKVFGLDAKLSIVKDDNASKNKETSIIEEALNVFGGEIIED